MPRKVMGPAEPVYLVDENGDEILETNPFPISVQQWHYVGGEVITPGGVSALATIPDGTTIVELAPEGEDMYYAINAATASTLSAGYIADGGRELVGPIDNLNQLAVFMAGVNIIHLQYFREA